MRAIFAETPQQRRQLAHLFQQISVDHNVPLCILVEAIERVFTVALVVFTDLRCTMSTAGTAHGVEGHVSGSTGDVRCCRVTVWPLRSGIRRVELLLWHTEGSPESVRIGECEEAGPAVRG